MGKDLSYILKATIDERNECMYTIMTNGQVNIGCHYHVQPGHNNYVELRTGRRTYRPKLEEMNRLICKSKKVV